MSQRNWYYTAGEAQKKLGLTKARFHKMVRQGLIPRVVLPGMKHAVYPRRDIDALSLSITLPQEGVIFSSSTIADLVEELRIGTKCFGQSFLISLSDMIAFQRKSEFSFHSLKRHGSVVGYVSMFHLTEAFLDDLLTGRQTLRKVTLKDILPFERLQPFDVYINTVVVDPDLSAHLQHLYTGIIIIHFIDLLAKLQTNDYQIHRLYTAAVTKDYERLVQKLGFQLLEGKSLVPNRAIYEYLLDTEGTKNLQRLEQQYRPHLQSSARDFPP